MTPDDTAYGADTPVQMPLGTPNDWSAYSGIGYRYGRMQSVGGLVIHHTGDHHSQMQGIYDAKASNLGAQYRMDRQGNVIRIVPEGAKMNHMLTGWGLGQGRNNSNTEGIEVEARSDADMTPEQKAALPAFVGWHSDTYGYDPTQTVFGHSEVNPGHRTNEGADLASGIRNGTIALAHGVLSPETTQTAYTAAAPPAPAPTAVAAAAPPATQPPAAQPPNAWQNFAAALQGKAPNSTDTNGLTTFGAALAGNAPAAGSDPNAVQQFGAALGGGTGAAKAEDDALFNSMVSDVQNTPAAPISAPIAPTLQQRMTMMQRLAQLARGSGSSLGTDAPDALGTGAAGPLGTPGQQQVQPPQAPNPIALAGLYPFFGALG